MLLAAPWDSEDCTHQALVGYWCGYSRQLVLGGYIDELKSFGAGTEFWPNLEYDVRSSFIEIVKCDL